MFRVIAIVLGLLCMTVTVFAQAGDVWQERSVLVNNQQGPDQGRDGYYPLDGQHWYSLEISSSYGGSVTPDGLVRVREGDTVILSIRPDRGFHIQKVIIDGRRVSTESVYKFSDVHRNHTAYIEFAPNPS